MPKAKENQELLYRISDEGLDYTFTCYSEWDEIKDAEFHKLRRNYLKAYNALAKYLGVEGSIVEP